MTERIPETAFAGIEEQADERRRSIDVTEMDLPEITRLAIEALAAWNDPPNLFQQSASVVRVDRDEDKRPIIKQVRNELMRHAMAASARWIKKGKNVEPPRPVVENVLATPELPFPGLRGIVSAPFLTPDGELVRSTGYDPSSRLYLALDIGMAVPEIATKPSRVEVEAAVAIIDDVFADFPFSGGADRAHAFALLLLPFARELISGPTPLHVPEAPTVGTGKTLLVQAALHAACGDVPLRAFPQKEEERQKFIFAALLRGRNAIVLDNVAGKLDSAVLAGALTAQPWSDRVLGLSSDATVINRATWAATTNNASLSTDIARRSVPIRLDARTERPFERAVTYRHPHLLDFVRANRGAIIAAALTILRAWIAAGKPKPQRQLGSFEAWSNVIGGALNFASIDGFLANTARLLDVADEDGASLRALVMGWATNHGEDNVKASDLVQLAEIAGLDLGDKDGAAKTRKLGLVLRSRADCVFGDYRLERRARLVGVQHWGLTRMKSSGDVVSGGDFDGRSYIDKAGISHTGGLETHHNSPLTTSGKPELLPAIGRYQV